MSKNKKIILIILSIFIVLSLFLGISYAYYIKSHSQENSNVVKTKCLNFSITNEKNDINLEEQYPIQDTEGRKLTPYQFTIINTCEQFISYNVNLESLEATTMDSSAVKVMINNEAPVNLSTLESTSVSIDTSKDSKILATGSLGSNDSVDYTLRLWMDYGTTADTSSMNKVFESKIVVTATVGTYKPSDYVTTLHDAILVNEYGVPDVNNAISKIEAKGTPDLSKPAPVSADDLSDKGLYKSEDDFGNTYYYRGKVSNNNVYFAGYYWQIVRINGDGSIRLLYNGTEKNATSSQSGIGNSVFNIVSNSPIYVGYMYGNSESTNFDDAHANTNDSAIKKYIDNWYKTNILSLEYDNYISPNSCFCGDRTITTGDGLSSNVVSHFGAFGRHYKQSASFKCPNIERDMYSYQQSNVGNKALQYSIGLISYDELVYAGFNHGIENKYTWAYSSASYWTISPAYYEPATSDASAWYFYDEWKRLHYNTVRAIKLVRPVINLKSNVEISGGIGSINDPYIVKTN